MRDADSTQDFKEGLIKMIKYETHSTIREVCEAISQMYDVELIDVIEDVLEERDQDPFKAASKNCQASVPPFSSWCFFLLCSCCMR